MQLRRLLLGLIVSVVAAMAAFPVHAAFVAATGYQAEELYTSAGSFTTVGGLSHRGGFLYFGQSTAINSLDLTDNSVTTEGTVPSNTGNSLVTVNPDSGTVYTAHGTSYSDPYPHKMGYFDAGVFQEQLAMDGIYDAAVNGAGELFIAANPANTGARIYRYNWADGSTTEVANLGGPSGGLTFDPDNNLYCSAYNEGKVLTFTAAQVGTGGLTRANATTALDLDQPGYLAFSDDGNLFASYLDASWNNHVGLFDVTTNQKLADVADGGGKMAWANGTLYTVDTDWIAYASTIQAVSAVPEPSSALLLAIGATALVPFGRRVRRRF